MTQTDNLTEIFKISKQALDFKEIESLVETFENEAQLRKKFNMACLNFTDSICVDSDKIVLPKLYTENSIVSDALVKILEVHRVNRKKISSRIKFILKPLRFIEMLLGFKRNNLIEDNMFITYSKINVISFFLKRFVINLSLSFCSYNYKKNPIADKILICFEFPWFSFVKEGKSISNSVFSSKNVESFSLAEYLSGPVSDKSTGIISIGEYHLKRWDSSAELHHDLIMKREVVVRHLAPPNKIIKQLYLFIQNSRECFNLFSNLNIKSQPDQGVLWLSLLNYYTKTVDIQYLLSSFVKKNKSVKLLFNANSFYSFPWYAHFVEKKYHYMYADNCCYFPFSYFSPNDKVNKIPKLINNKTLFYGFLEWPIYNRVIGKSDIGYQGVARLTNSIRKVDEKSLVATNEESSLQLGAIQRFHSDVHVCESENTEAHTGGGKILYLDGSTRTIDAQLSVFDVPSTFVTPKIAKMYIDSLFEYVKQHDVTLYIRPKYTATKDLIESIKEFKCKNQHLSDRVVIVSSRLPLQEILSSINPILILVKPMSSTLLFARKLGYQAHYYIPESLQKVFNSLSKSHSVPESDFKGNWVSESSVNLLIE